ncbi:MAG: endopeptidase La [Christensenellales bacterium]
MLEQIIYPMLPLRGLVVFPHMVMHFDVGRGKSIAALEEAMVHDQNLVLVAQKEAGVNDPNEEQIFDVGTLSSIKQILKMPGDTIRVLVEGIARVRILNYVQKDPFFKIHVKQDDSDYAMTLEMEALRRSVTAMFTDFAQISNRISADTVLSLSEIENPSHFADVVAANVLVKFEDKQQVLECIDPADRMERLLSILARELELQKIENKISLRVKGQIDKNQKEYFLREQLKAIQKELGDKDGTLEVEELRERINKAKLSDEAREKAIKELNRMSHMAPSSAEGTVSRTYIEWILDLPWNIETKDNKSLRNAKKILDEDHFGLEKVKERIIEYMAVRQLKEDMRGSILCLIGPPGVGKTSIARSIARAMNRKFVRMSLGGVRDEAEIRGHRRTYIGAIPGRIIAGIKQAGSVNPVFLFDEIDKMASDFRGDPASAMLEVLDSEQNFAFRDHYLELAFDLSKIMFITTANSADTIPRPLYDRMEIIEVSSYTEEEKLGIAKGHLLKKQLREHGLKRGNISIPDQVMRVIINRYTREAGVRTLERRLAEIARKVACKIVEGRKRVMITEKNLHKFLGNPKYRHGLAGSKDEVGVVTGLAWTSVGGETLSIEVTHMSGTGKLELTGQLGDVMKESARAGYSYVRAHSKKLNIDENFHDTMDIHIHIPEGAIPKDGPSAGISMATAMISALSGLPVRKDVAMTGEITLRGRILPIGGVKEKVLAANRAGIHTVILPAENEKDTEDIPENIRETMAFVFVKELDDVLKIALLQDVRTDAD